MKETDSSKLSNMLLSLMEGSNDGWTGIDDVVGVSVGSNVVSIGDGGHGWVLRYGNSMDRADGIYGHGLEKKRWRQCW